MFTPLNIILMVFIFIGFCFFMRPFVIKFYYNYIDKSPIEINIDGRDYIIDRKSKKYIVEQMAEQDKKYEQL